MSKEHNVHLVIRNTRSDDIEKIVKLQKESFLGSQSNGNCFCTTEQRNITSDIIREKVILPN